MEWTAELVEREGGRLRRYIRRRVPNPADVDDILQDVFYELVLAAAPIDNLAAWLTRVARNRIVDLFRRRRPASAAEADSLPTPRPGPDAAYAQAVLYEELAAALAELPDDQRLVFIAHELEGRGYDAIAAATGIGVNALAQRKHRAVRHLRRRLQSIHEEYS